MQLLNFLLPVSYLLLNTAKLVLAVPESVQPFTLPFLLSSNSLLKDCSFIGYLFILFSWFFISTKQCYSSPTLMRWWIRIIENSEFLLSQLLQSSSLALADLRFFAIALQLSEVRAPFDGTIVYWVLERWTRMRKFQNLFMLFHSLNLVLLVVFSSFRGSLTSRLKKCYNLL